MHDVLKGTVQGETLISWLVIAFLVGYFIYKEWPEFKKRISSGTVSEEKQKAVEGALEHRLDVIENRLTSIECTLVETKEKLSNDYQRINEVERLQKQHKKVQEDGQEELEIIMRALLGVLRGLQEQGTNGPTKAAEQELSDYLNKKAHASSFEQEDDS